MTSPSIQRLKDPEIPPSDLVIAEALGEANDAYVKFVSQLTQHDIQFIWRYYTDGKSWLAKGLYQWQGVRGGQKEITVFWLSIWDDFFRVTIYLPEKARDEALSLPLDETMKQVIVDSTILGEKFRSLPLTFQLDSERLFDSLFTLIEFKKHLK